MATSSPEHALSRDVADGAVPLEELLRGAYAQSWAVVIGINDYQHYNKLDYAVSDAVGVARILIERLQFPPGNVSLVIDSVAGLPLDLGCWLAAIRPRLGLFSDQPSREVISGLLLDHLPACTGVDDRALIYFAGHGKPRRPVAPDGRLEPNLVPGDARPGKWGDHLPLEDLLAKSVHVPAKHVLYVIDACSSGLAGMRAVRNERFERGLLGRKARQCVTAGTADELAADRGHDGHSLFTFNFLAMLGELRLGQDDGILLASSLGAELTLRVGTDPQSQQTPKMFDVVGHKGGEFVFFAPAMPLSLEDTAWLAETLVDDVGRCLNEPAPVAFAQRLWQRVLDRDPVIVNQRSARRGLARGALWLGDGAAAGVHLAAPDLREDPDAIAMRAIALLRETKLADATRELEQLARHPEHPYAGWAACVLPQARAPRGRRHALLIGVDEIAAVPEGSLPSARADLAALTELFTHQLGFDQVTALCGREATVAAIGTVFARAALRCEPADTFVCWFCGRGFLREGTAIYATYDLPTREGPGLTEHAIDDLMRSIPARDKLLVNDSCHLAPREEPAYRVVYGCQRDERGWDLQDEDGRPRGAFTYLFERALRSLGNVAIGRLIANVTGELAAHGVSQTPGFTGSDDSSFVARDPLALELIDLAERSYRAFSHADLDRFTTWLNAHEASNRRLAPLWLALGRAQLARGRAELASGAFQRAEDKRGYLPWLRCEVQRGRYAEAFALWQRIRSADPGGEECGELDALLARFQAGRKHALLVETRLTDPGPRSWFTKIGSDLMKRWGLGPDQVTVRTNPGAAELRAELERLAEVAGEDPALFVFVGPGAEGEDLSLCVRDPDHGLGHVSAAELRARTARCTNLTSAVLFTTIYTPKGLNALPPRDPTSQRLGIGVATLVGSPQVHRDLTDSRVGPDIDAVLGVLGAGDGSLDVATWQHGAESSPGLSVRGDASAPVLAYHHEGRRACELVEQLEHAPLRRARALLARLVDDAELADEAWLLRAILDEQLQLHDEAVNRVDEGMNRAGQARAAAADAELYYWRGRALLGLARHGEAADDLATAISRKPDHARAHLYRAFAIHQLIATNLETQMHASVEQYINLGAPLGIDDVRRVRKSRR